MITQTTLENANKFAYLLKAYPEKALPEIISLFWLASIDINCSIWAAIELEFIREPNPDTGFSQIIKEPKPWQFGKELDELEENILYAFTKLNADEKDMEENFLTAWLKGYAPHDTLIAVKHLLDEKRLHEYQIEDGENKYIFYTLPENAHKNWGAKQFKVNPLTGEENAEAMFDNTKKDKAKKAKKARRGKESKE